MLLNGLHEVRLSATDNGGRTDRATTVVVVKENLKVGHFTVSFVDLEVPVAGQPIRVTRTYDSRDKRRGDFGHGWRLDVSNVRVQTAATLGLAWYGTASPGAFPTYCLQPTAPPVVTLTLPFSFDRGQGLALQAFVNAHVEHDALETFSRHGELDITCHKCGAFFYFARKEHAA